MRRGAAVAASLTGAVVMAAAVVLLRGEVEPVAAPTSGPSVPTTTVVIPPEPGLPEREAEAPLVDGPLVEAPGTVVLAQADRARIVHSDFGGSRLTVIDRAHRGPPVVHPKRERSTGFGTGWLLRGDSVFFVERADTTGGRAGAGRLMRLDLTTGTTTELPLRSVAAAAVGTILVGVGTELLLVGQTAQGHRACVVAVRPSDGADRIVLCAELDRQAAHLAPFGDDALVGYSSGRPGCSDWLRVSADGATRPVRLHPGACEPLSLAVLGVWRVTAPSGSGLIPDGPLGTVAAYLGERRMVLDDRGRSPIACGRHVYWTAERDGRGLLRRWLPGDDHVEAVEHLSRGRRIAEITCRDGVLAVPTVDADGTGGSSQVRILDQP